jgi:hypothetical protein
MLVGALRLGREMPELVGILSPKTVLALANSKTTTSRLRSTSDTSRLETQKNMTGYGVVGVVRGVTFTVEASH